MSGSRVTLDTQLAMTVLAQGGVICWHDANPKPAYEDVRRFLEAMPRLHGIATEADFIGGVAAWSEQIEDLV